MHNPFLQRKVALEEKKQKVKEAINKSPISDQAQMMINAISRNGVLKTRQALLEGLPKDWNEDYWDKNVTQTELLAPYYNEPKFQELIKKLQISWPEIEKLAREFIG